jgi:hypothetical protein
VAGPIALFDANVLASMTSTDLVIQGAHDGLFGARWTDAIHNEWIKAVLSFQPSRSPALLDRRRRRMDANVIDALVTGYEHLIPTLALPDADDRHVLAAAIAAQSQFIVTKNLKDFPVPILAAHGITPIHPDAFFLARLAEDPVGFISTVKANLARMKNPPISVDEYLGQLRKVEMPQLAAELHRLRPIF